MSAGFPAPGAGSLVQSATGFGRLPDELDPRSFERLRAIIRRHGGINLAPGKESLVSSRVGRRLRALGLSGFPEYLGVLEGRGGGAELVHLIDAISTNVTSFFREPDHFEHLRARAGEWHAKGARRIRLWSAACSTGEEPWSLAMTLSDALPPAGLDLRILATDISTSVLARARSGAYESERVAPVPPDLKARFLEPPRRGGAEYLVRDALRPLVSFCRLNLASPPFPMSGPFDAIFCRNVMIYFDEEVRSRLMAECHRLLRPGGYLYIGHAESLSGLDTPFRAVRPSIYRREGRA